MRCVGVEVGLGFARPGGCGGRRAGVCAIPPVTMLRRVPSGAPCSQDRVKQAMGRLKRFKRADLEVHAFSLTIPNRASPASAH